MAIIIHQGAYLNLAANATSVDQMANVKGRFVFAGDVVRLYSIASASGVNIQFGTASDIFVDDKEHTAIGTTLSTTDHLVGEFTVTQDGEMSLKFRETAGAATTDMLFRVEKLEAGVDF